MKNKILLLVLGLFLIFAFISCDSGNSDDTNTPVITDLILMNKANFDTDTWISTTTFKTTETVFIGIQANNPDADWDKWVLTGKQGGTIIGDGPFEFDASMIAPETSIYASFDILNPGYLSAGTYTIDVYLVNKSGKKSNTKSITFTLTD